MAATNNRAYASKYVTPIIHDQPDANHAPVDYKVSLYRSRDNVIAVYVEYGTDTTAHDHDVDGVVYFCTAQWRFKAAKRAVIQLVLSWLYARVGSGYKWDAISAYAIDEAHYDGLHKYIDSLVSLLHPAGYQYNAFQQRRFCITDDAAVLVVPRYDKPKGDIKIIQLHRN